MLIFQSPVRANSVLRAISANVGSETTAYRVAVAYVTREGARTLVEAVKAQVGEHWPELSKTVITCFDFGHTEPGALVFLQEQGFEVRIANLGADGEIRLRSSLSSFHPKLYLACGPERVRAVIGSANLSRRALSVNAEAMSLIELDLQEVEEIWTELEIGSVLLSDEMLETYRNIRPQQRATMRQDEPPVPLPAAPEELLTFRNAVETGEVNPVEYRALWVEAGGMSGGSKSQLELPRFAQRFFGYQFDAYDDEHLEIGRLTLVTATGFWEKPLSWHGGNRMERINLPTPAQSGLWYEDEIVLFQRSGASFEIAVSSPDSARASRWMEESAANGTLFQIRANSGRRCGLI